MEEYGIGRPSTYASIMSTLVRRVYVELDKRRFKPTNTGRVVERFLENHFTEYVDYEFTARLEDELDEVSRGELDWVHLLKSFWKPFQNRVNEKQESVSRDEAKAVRVLGTDPKSGKPLSVRLGRFGPHAQIGTRDDEDKPQFAGLRAGQSLETITLEEALDLFKLPRELGQTAAGEKVFAAIGRFGPYIRYDSKFVSLKDVDPLEVTLEHALKLIAEKKEFDANRVIKTFDGTDIQVLRGRYGPYITDGNKNARMPKDREPESLTQAECEELIAAAPDRKRGKKKVSKKKVTKKKTARKKTTRKNKKTKKKLAKT
jgi:DNA topoisomerase-1